jgi:hypothetical protein
MSRWYRASFALLAAVCLAGGSYLIGRYWGCQRQLVAIGICLIPAGLLSMMALFLETTTKKGDNNRGAA